MITTIIRCLPVRRGGLRTWRVTQSIAGRPARSLDIIAARGTDAMAAFERAMGLPGQTRIHQPEAA